MRLNNGTKTSNKKVIKNQDRLFELISELTKIGVRGYMYSNDPYHVATRGCLYIYMDDLCFFEKGCELRVVFQRPDYKVERWIDSFGIYRVCVILDKQQFNKFINNHKHQKEKVKGCNGYIYKFN